MIVRRISTLFFVAAVLVGCSSSDGGGAVSDAPSGADLASDAAADMAAGDRGGADAATGDVTPGPADEGHTADTPSPTDGAVDAPVDATAPVPLAVRCQEISDGHGAAGATALDVTVVGSGLSVPWAVDWLPDGSMIVTERVGSLRRVDPNGDLIEAPLAAVPITTGGEGGLLGLAVSPSFDADRAIYLYFTSNQGGPVHNRVERWRLADDLGSAAFDAVVVDAIPARQFHNGGRLRFGPDGHLYVGTGDATTPAFSQDPQNLAGKLLRVRPDGTVPDDNPWGSAAWLIGLRNLQAFDWRADGRLVLADHGPSGARVEGGRTGYDELNIAEPGDNLGWPDVYRCESQGDLLPPAMTWRQSLPPGGAAVVPATAIPSWAGDVVVGVLGFGDNVGHLHRFALSDDGNVTLSEVYLRGEYGRLRDVTVGPDGALYATTSNCDGRATCAAHRDRILRITGP